MSHFYCMVLVSKATEDIEGRVMELMDPFDENMEVEPYYEPVSDEAVKRFITFYTREFEEARFMDEEGRERVLMKQRDHGPPVAGDFESFKPYLDDWNGGAWELDDDGNIVERSTYNPLSKWDWYQIGGRWTGVLDEYDPAEDIENWEVCFLCHGTGKRDDETGRHARERDPSYTCNGCSGKGYSVKWPTSWKPHAGDVRPVKDLLKAWDEFVMPPPEELQRQKAEHKKDPFGTPSPRVAPGFIPFAVLTPEGEWVERGRMGWFGMAYQEEEARAWAERVAGILRKYADHAAVVVDCHI